MKKPIGNIKKWYMKHFPADELGRKIPESWTFAKLWQALHAKNKTIEQYEIIHDWADSTIRQRVFLELSRRKTVTYDEIYFAWLRTPDPRKKIRYAPGPCGTFRIINA